MSTPSPSKSLRQICLAWRADANASHLFDHVPAAAQSAAASAASPTHQRGSRLTRCSFDKANGVLIHKPGVYCITSNLHFEPESNNAAAITIAASNVVLKLGSHKLSGNKKSGSVGILVERGVSNVSIVGSAGATVCNFGAAGVQVRGATQKILLENFCAEENGLTSFPFVAMGQSPTGGILVGEQLITGGENANRVDGLTLRNVRAARNVFVGLIVDNTKNLIMEHCDFSFNESFGAVLGFLLLLLDDDFSDYPTPLVDIGRVQHCNFNCNGGAGELFKDVIVFGCALARVHNVSFDDCHFDGNVSNVNNPGFPFPPTPAQQALVGFFSQTRSSGVDCDAVYQCTFRRCTFNSNQNALLAEGIHYSGSNSEGINDNRNNVMEKCVLNGNQTRGPDADWNMFPMECNGLFTIYMRGLVLRDCVMAGNQVLSWPGKNVKNNQPEPANAAGLMFAGARGVENFVFQDAQNDANTVQRCVATDTQSFGQSVGFYVEGESNGALFENCSAVRTTSPRFVGQKTFVTFANTAPAVMLETQPQPLQDFVINNLDFANSNVSNGTLALFLSVDLNGGASPATDKVRAEVLINGMVKAIRDTNIPPGCTNVNLFNTATVDSFSMSGLNLQDQVVIRLQGLKISDNTPTPLTLCDRFASAPLRVETRSRIALQASNGPSFGFLLQNDVSGTPSDNIDGFLVQRCQSVRAVGTDASAGFLVTGSSSGANENKVSNVVLDQCSSHFNAGDGFRFQLSERLRTSNCDAVRNTGIGFVDTATDSKNSFTSNRAEANGGGQYQVSYTGGSLNVLTGTISNAGLATSAFFNPTANIALSE